MRTLDGFPAAWNYTIGPAHLWEGLAGLERLNARHMPVVLVAEDIPAQDLARIEMTRILGYVIEKGGRGSPARLLLWGGRRAAIMGAAGARNIARPGMTVIVDGVLGKAIFDPDARTLARYEELRRAGPPPEPPGIAAQILESARDPLKAAARLDPRKLERFAKYGDAFAAFARVLPEGVVPAAEDLAVIRASLAGKPSEKALARNLERFAARRAEEARARTSGGPGGGPGAPGREGKGGAP